MTRYNIIVVHIVPTVLMLMAASSRSYPTGRTSLRLMSIVNIYYSDSRTTEAIYLGSREILSSFKLHRLLDEYKLNFKIKLEAMI
ncbi:hypothetical protein C8Q75DRAFT_597929 [Abortiporus biennis]|nr:hypothetical protein C8Q75DRAFT_597929 [Abortiporus biennis]